MDINAKLLVVSVLSCHGQLESSVQQASSAQVVSLNSVVRTTFKIRSDKIHVNLALPDTSAKSMQTATIRLKSFAAKISTV